MGRTGARGGENTRFKQKRYTVDRAEFKGKIVCVTGGSRGIGRAVALAFAERGATVAVNFKSDRAAALDTINALPGDGHLALRADVSDPDAAQRLIQTVVRELGKLDILINNAGTYAPHPLTGTEYADWQRAWQHTLRTNLLAAANLSYHAARHLKARGEGGRIVSVSSRGAYRGEPDAPAYAASKAGLNALTQSLARDLAPYGIGVAAVAPGFVATDMAKPHLEGAGGDAIRAQSPFNRVARPEEVARAVLFLCSEAALFSSGTIVDVNGASYLR